MDTTETQDELTDFTSWTDYELHHHARFGNNSQRQAVMPELQRRRLPIPPSEHNPLDKTRRFKPINGSASTVAASKPPLMKSTRNRARKEGTSVKPSGNSRTARRAGTGRAAIRPGRTR